jgi:hypothetical protein
MPEDSGGYIVLEGQLVRLVRCRPIPDVSPPSPFLLTSVADRLIMLSLSSVYRHPLEISSSLWRVERVAGTSTPWYETSSRLFGHISNIFLDAINFPSSFTHLPPSVFSLTRLFLPDLWPIPTPYLQFPHSSSHSCSPPFDNVLSLGGC